MASNRFAHLEPRIRAEVACETILDRDARSHDL